MNKVFAPCFTAALLNGKLDTPTSCDMARRSCSGFMRGWTVGMSGDCLPDYYGYPLKGYTKIILEVKRCL